MSGVFQCCMLNVGVISADNEDEAQRPEEAFDGEIQRRGGAGLWWGGQVICC